MKREGFLPRVDFIRLNERRIIFHILISFTCFCAYLFRCKLVYDMINRQQDESAANDTIPLKKKNCGGYSWHHIKVLSMNQRNILYFQ